MPALLFKWIGKVRSNLDELNRKLAPVNSLKIKSSPLFQSTNLERAEYLIQGNLWLCSKFQRKDTILLDLDKLDRGSSPPNDERSERTQFDLKEKIVFCLIVKFTKLRSPSLNLLYFIFIKNKIFTFSIIVIVATWRIQRVNIWL